MDQYFLAPCKGSSARQFIPFAPFDVTFADTCKMMRQSYAFREMKCCRLARQSRHHYCGTSGKVTSEIQTHLQEILLLSNSCTAHTTTKYTKLPQNRDENVKFSVRHNVYFLWEVQATCFGLTNPSPVEQNYRSVERRDYWYWT